MLFKVTFNREEVLEDERTVFDYASIDDPLRQLPPPTLCNETIDEWAVYKKWEIDEKARRAKEKITHL
jgi:hypothetical protein